MAKLSSTPIQKSQKKVSNEDDYSSDIVESSATDGCENVSLGIHGPPGVGKTFCALTASKFWPDNLPAKTLTKLSDVLHVAWDPEAVTGLREVNIEVPTINIKKLLRPLTEEEEDARKRGAKVRPYAKTILDAMTIVNKEQLYFAEHANKKYGSCYIIQDTASWLNVQLEKYYITGEGAPRTKSGAIDTRQGWKSLAGAHSLFISYNMNTPANIIYLFHAQANLESDTDEGVAQKKRNDAAGLKAIVPQITGSSRHSYNASMSATFWMTRKPNIRGNGYSRTLHTQEMGDAQTKNRWAFSLAPEEEAHLGKLFAKIRAPYGK